LYGFASGFVAAIRGTPFLVQLYIVYYVLIFNTRASTFCERCGKPLLPPP